MHEHDWDQDARRLEALRAQLGVLEADTSLLGKTLTYEASNAVDHVTRKILERSWELEGRQDPHQDQVDQLLERAQTLRRKVSRFAGPRYDAEYRAWIQSWKGTPPDR